MPPSPPGKPRKPARNFPRSSKGLYKNETRVVYHNKLVDYTKKYRGIWIGHRFDDRKVMAVRLGNKGNYSGEAFVRDKAGQGVEAWDWLETKASRQHEAVDVA